MHARLQSSRYVAVAALSAFVYDRSRRRSDGQIRELVAAQARLTGVQERLAETQHNLAEAQRRLAEAQVALTINQRATDEEVDKLRDVYPYAEGKDPWEPRTEPEE